MRAFVDLLAVFGPRNVGSPPPPRRAPSLSRDLLFQDAAFELLIDRPDDPAAPVLLHTAEVGPWRAWMVGEFYGCGPGAGASGTSLERFTGDLAAGRADAASLNGHFFLLAWNREERQWHTWADRFGTLHAYACQGDGRAAIGTFSPAVAAAASARKLDLEAILAFLAFGFFPADRTHFSDVRILRPATHSVFDEHGVLLRQERTWNWRHDPAAAPPYEEALDEFDDLIGAVLREQLGAGRVAVPVSGGLDSRTTVSVIPRGARGAAFRQGLWAYSYGYTPGSVETRIARKVAAARSMPVSTFTVPPYLFADLDRVTASIEGFQDITQPRQAAIADEIAHHADAVVAAHWGDVWMDDAGLLDRPKSGPSSEEILDHAVHKFQKRGRAWLLEQFIPAKHGTLDPERLQIEFVRSALEDLRDIEDPDFRIKALKTDHWSFRWTIASLRAFQIASFPRLPFYDTRLSDFFCRLPSAWMRGRQFQVDYLKRYNSDLAAIQWQETGRDLFQYGRPDLLAFPRRVVLGAWRRVTPRLPAQNWEVQFLCPDGRAGLDRWLLQPGLRIHDLFAQNAIRDLVDAFYAEPLARHRGYPVSMLLTLSSWLERWG